MKFQTLFLSLLLMATEVSAQSIAFHEIPTYQDRDISIRGFLYQSDAQHWILAKTPHLKSCCVGTPEYAKEQIVVSGKIEPSFSGHPVRVTGHLVIEDEHYHLKDAVLMPEQLPKWPVLSLVLAGISIAATAAVIFFLKKRH